MFERNDINDLFLASISVKYPDSEMLTDNFGGILKVSIGGYGYTTILKREEEKYIDLNNPKVEITTTRDPFKTSYTIDYMEPLSKYYNEDGKRNQTFSNRKARKIAETYYNEFYKDEKEAQKVKVYK